MFGIKNTCDFDTIRHDIFGLHRQMLKSSVGTVLIWLLHREGISLNWTFAGCTIALNLGNLFRTARRIHELPVGCEIGLLVDQHGQFELQIVLPPLCERLVDQSL